MVMFPVRTAMGDCGIGGRAGRTYSFVHTDIMQMQSDYAPYLMGFGVIGDYYKLEQRDASYDDNIGEWRGRFCGYPDSADIEEILYDTDIDQLAELRDVTSRYKDKETFYELEKNTFAQVIKGNGCTDVVDYLIYAKQCEPYCVKGDLWSEKPKDVAQMFMLINQGRQLFKNTNAPFLKLRYAYQMIRLAHYAKDYPAVLTIYDDVIPKTDKVKSIINYWILAHKAGALKSMGKRAEAAYLFAVVFRYCPSKRRQAFESFDIQTENEWQYCLNSCRDDKERAALYAIRASRDKAKGLDDMVNLYNLDPTNEHLDMLLIRETLRLEKILIGHTFRRERYAPEVIVKNKLYCQNLRYFVSQVLQRKTARNLALWQTTEGYLTLLLGDWNGAIRSFFTAKSMTQDPVLLEQIDAFDLAARITGLQANDPRTDAVVNALRKTDAYVSDADFEPFFYEKMGNMYKIKNDVGIAYLCDLPLGQLERNPRLDVIDNLIALCRKPDKTLFERELLMAGGNKTIETQLWHIKARYHLSRFEMERANEAYRNIPIPERGKKYTPFVDKIKDCVNCVQSDTALYDRAEFTAKMLELDYQIRANLIDPALGYYRLGLGYYNMTYFGNSSGIADFNRSGSSWQYLNSGDAVHPLPNYPQGNFEVTDVSLAMQYFEKARQASLDRAFQARCTFWCAKCEQNMFYVDKQSRYNVGGKTMPSVPPQYRKYFKLLKDYYRDTDFYRLAQTECKYFNYYSVR
jgi:hypothetical protein